MFVDGKPPPDADDTQTQTNVLMIMPSIFYLYSALSGVGVCVAVGFLAFNLIFMKLK